MKLARHSFLTVILSGIFSTAVFAFDGGILVSNDSIFKTNKNQKMCLDQKNDAAAWLKIPFGKNADSYFVAEGLYKFEYNQNAKTSYNYLDVNLFKFALLKKFSDNLIKFDCGRIFTSSLNPIIFSQNSDGINLMYRNNFLTASVFGSYTGLLNRNVVKMINSKDFSAANPKKIYELSDKYVVGEASLVFNNLFLNQTLAAQFNGAFRLNTISDNRMFATLLLKGPLVKNLIYSLDGTVEYSKYSSEKEKISVLSQFILGYYFNLASISVNAIYASNDFNAITSSVALNNYSEPEYKGLFKTGLSLTCKPFVNLLVSASFDAAFDTEKSFELKGIQYNEGIDYQIFNDLYVGVMWN